LNPWREAVRAQRGRFQKQKFFKGFTPPAPSPPLKRRKNFRLKPVL
jgi:hypothetical protein